MMKVILSSFDQIFIQILDFIPKTLTFNPKFLLFDIGDPVLRSKTLSQLGHVLGFFLYFKM